MRQATIRQLRRGDRIIGSDSTYTLEGFTAISRYDDASLVTHVARLRDDSGELHTLRGDELDYEVMVAEDGDVEREAA